MVQPLWTDLYPIMIIQDIESHRLFTADMRFSYTVNPSEETQETLTLKSMIKWGPKIAWNLIPDKGEDTEQTPFSAGQTTTESNLYLKMSHLETSIVRAEGKRKVIPKERRTVVISKKGGSEEHRHRKF